MVECMKNVLIKTAKYIKIIFLLFLISLVVGNVILPAFHKNTDEGRIKELAAGMTGKTGETTERILCIDDNEEALLWRLRMIGSAKETIVLATFDFRADHSGTDIISALYAAAERGVKVKILVDGLYQAVFSDPEGAFQTLGAHENVELRIYNSVSPGNIYRLNYRMHDKYLIVDEKMYMLGGRNTNDIFLGNYTNGINMDRDILVCASGKKTGQSLQEVQEYFQKIWEEPCVRKKGLKKTGDIAASAQMLRNHYQELKGKYQDDVEKFTAWEEATFPVNSIALLTNGTGAENKSPQVLDVIGQMAVKGQNVLIQTPYIICDSHMYEVLESIADNAELNIILNAVERGSNPWGCTDYLNNRKKVLDTGAAVFELMNEHAVHTKTVVIDDNISIVGSYNYDMRSTYLDTEMMLVIESEELNSHIRQMASEYMEKSKAVLPDGRISEGAYYEPREMHAGKKAVYGILRIITVPFRHLL